MFIHSVFKNNTAPCLRADEASVAAVLPLDMLKLLAILEMQKCRGELNYPAGLAALASLQALLQLGHKAKLFRPKEIIDDFRKAILPLMALQPASPSFFLANAKLGELAPYSCQLSSLHAIARNQKLTIKWLADFSHEQDRQWLALFNFLECVQLLQYNQLYDSSCDSETLKEFSQNIDKIEGLVLLKPWHKEEELIQDLQEIFVNMVSLAGQLNKNPAYLSPEDCFEQLAQMSSKQLSLWMIRLERHLEAARIPACKVNFIPLERNNNTDNFTPFYQEQTSRLISKRL